MRIVLALLLCSVSVVAVAQPTGAILLPVAASPSEANDVAQAASRQLRGRVDLRDSSATSALLRRHLTLRRTSLPLVSFDDFSEGADSALQLLARGQLAEAQAQLSQTLQIAEASMTYYGRNIEQARTVLDACLFQVRLYLEEGLSSDAARQTVSCRTMVPTTTPTNRLHPPEVQELLAEVDSMERTAVVSVSADVEGCTVRTSGLPSGVTPVTLSFIPGTYEMQVECHGEHASVIGVSLTPGEQIVNVDSSFQEVSLEGRPHLANAEAQRISALARMLRTTIIIAYQDSNGLRLTRVSPAGEHSSLTAGSPIEPRTVAHQSADLASPRNDGLRTAFGVSLSILGVAALGATWAVLHSLPAAELDFSLSSSFDNDYLELQDILIRRRRALGTSAGLGAAMLMAGLPLWVPRTRGGRIAGWILGVLGTGMVVTGIPFLLRERTCLDDECVQRNAPYITGITLLASGLPFVALPFTLLGAPASGIALDLRAQGARLTVQW